jgi:hypothetical protein
MSLARRGRPGRIVAPLLPILLLVCCAPAQAEVTGQQVKRAIRKGVDYIKAHQGHDGSWPARWYAGGETCLATLALLQAGESVESRAVASALPIIATLQNECVYVTSLKIQVLAQVDPQKYRQEISDAAQWLANVQDVKGLWSYGPGRNRFDHSNSQFALLGLHAAAGAGAHINPGVWRSALAGVRETQKEDGGWTYQTRNASYGSMTAAGVSGLLILGQRLGLGREGRFENGRAPHCGEYGTNRVLAGGLAWLAQHFDATTNPRHGGQHTYYWLYSVERCGILSGQRYFGRHDWYREGAEFLVKTQQQNGSWGHDTVDTCFALLFLAKGHKAVLVQKLQWSDDDAWNPDRHDLENLLGYIGDKLGQPVTWQTVHFDAPLEDWLAAPLLYMQGHKFPKWNAEQRAKVRAFVDNGGTLLAEACCGREEFRTGFAQFAAETFPEFPLHELSAGHAVYHVLNDCEPYGLMGMDVACRTSVIFSPRDMSCLWEQASVPRLSEEAFQLGTNIAAYAMGRRPLIDRLDLVILPEENPAAAGGRAGAGEGGEGAGTAGLEGPAERRGPQPPERDALRLGQLVYDGDWRPFPRALVELAEFLRRETNLDVVTQYRPVRLTDPALYTCPIIYLAGRFNFELTEAERSALLAHLKRGGFLLVDNCCGPEPFDTTFRTACKRLWPDSPLEPLPPDHPIFTGKPGFDVTTVHYGPDVQKAEPELKTPQLWGIEIDGRLAVVYSPYALGCGLEGQEFDGCWGLRAEDARRLAANIVLYALTH